jgi:hypothetical protein
VTAGVVIAPYGLRVPRMGQMSFCVESCALLLVTAFANGEFGVVAMALDRLVQSHDPHGGNSLSVQNRQRN